MSSFEEQFQRALAAASAPGASRGARTMPRAVVEAFKKLGGDEVALNEDGQIVLYRRSRRDYGAESLTRRPTSLRVAGTGVDPSAFPARAGHETGRGHYVMLAAPHSTAGARRVFIDPTHTNWNPTTEKYELPESALTDAERSRRLAIIRQAIERRGGRLYEVGWTKGKPSKADVNAFLTWARVMRAGMSEDDAYDYVLSVIPRPVADKFFSTMRFTAPSSTRRVAGKDVTTAGPKIGEKDVFGLVPFSSKTPYPVAFSEGVPAIDWREF